MIKNKSQVYLVTGVAGFIGSKVAELLLKENHYVIGIDNLCNSYDTKLKQYRLDMLLNKKRFHFEKIDISDENQLETLMKKLQNKNSVFSSKVNGVKIDAIFNLAARAGVRYSVSNPKVYLEANIQGTLNLLEITRSYNIPKFILSSTSSLYGNSSAVTFSEDMLTDGPLSPYAATKKSAEIMCYTYHYLYKIDVTIFRYFTVYGPAGRPDMSPLIFTRQIFEGKELHLTGDGTQSRDFTYIDDIARGTILGLKKIGFEIINLGNDKPNTLNQLVEEIERKAKHKAKINYIDTHPADMKSTHANIEKAKRILGWEPKVNFERGIQKLVKWYIRERNWVSKLSE